MWQTGDLLQHHGFFQGMGVRRSSLLQGISLREKDGSIVSQAGVSSQAEQVGAVSRAKGITGTSVEGPMLSAYGASIFKRAQYLVVTAALMAHSVGPRTGP